MLLEKLEKLQVKEHLSDYKFADKLDVSPQLWQMTRTGKRDIGLAVLMGTTKAYPELAQDVLLFLGIDVNEITGIGDNITTTPETSQDGKIQAFRSFCDRWYQLGKKIHHRH